MSSWARAALILGAAGAVLGTLLDGIHTHTGTTWYPHPVFWLAASWTPAIFAFAGLSIGLTRPLLDRALKRDEPPPPPVALVGTFLLFVGAYFLSGFYPGTGLLKTTLLAVVFAVSWGAWDRTGVGLLCAVAAGAGGVGVESALVHAGAFFHRDTELFGVPIWLPLLYASASVSIGVFGQRLIRAGGSAPARESARTVPG